MIDLCDIIDIESSLVPQKYRETTFIDVGHVLRALWIRKSTDRDHKREREAAYQAVEKFIKLLVVVNGRRFEANPRSPRTNSVANERTSVPRCQTKGGRRRGSRVQVKLTYNFMGIHSCCSSGLSTSQLIASSSAVGRFCESVASTKKFPGQAQKFTSTAQQVIFARSNFSCLNVPPRAFYSSHPT